MDSQSPKTSLWVVVGGIIVAVITLIGTIVAALINSNATITSVQKPIEATQTAEAKLTSLAIAQAFTPTIRPSATATFVSTATPTIPPSATVPPTQSPTARPSAPIPLPQPSPTAIKFDVYDDFATFPNSNWGTTQGSIKPISAKGSLQLNADASSARDGTLFLNNLNRPIKLVETQLILKSAKPSSYTFLQVFLGAIDGKPWYANWGLMDTGEFFYASAPVGEAPAGKGRDGLEQSFPSLGIGKPNVLMVEWSGDQVLFYGNGQMLRSVKAKDGGWWVNLSVGTIGTGSSTTEFNWIRWSYRQ